MYLPIKQTNEAQLAYKQMLEKVEAIKLQMGNKWLLAKPVGKLQ